MRDLIVLCLADRNIAVDINHLTAAEANAKIRELQKQMCTALTSDEREAYRAEIGRLAQHAAFMNRNNLLEKK